MAYRLAVDIGGTFTDIILKRRDGSAHSVHKLLTSHDQPAESVLAGVEAILRGRESDVAAQDIEYVVHGTTLVANTLIERTGAEVALLVTMGFEDMLAMRREHRYDPWDLFQRFPDPLVAEDRRIGVSERTLADGALLQQVDREALREQIQDLGRDIDAVAVCFLHSHANRRNEEVAREVIWEMLGEVPVSLSSEVSGQVGEYDRMSTTVANAYVQPIVGRYLRRLSEGLRSWHAGIKLHLMLSDGGITSAESAGSFPVRLLESGPAAGISAACMLSRELGLNEIVAFDMGGTTAKCSIINNGDPLTTWELEAARIDRFKRGSGLPLQIPSVEMIEVGAGGGSIARIDRLGLLSIGPSSAGSEPGPACYSRGGTQPTVTDALLLLGYLNPKNFLGGRLELSADDARHAIAESIAEPEGLSVEQASLNIYRIACEQMAEAIHRQFAERGVDPRRYWMVAFGGAGPAHACEIARIVGVRGVVVPPRAGVFSSAGLLMAPFSFAVSQEYTRRLVDADDREMSALYAALEARARKSMDEAEDGEGDIEVTYSLDMRYDGQRHSLEVRWSGGCVTAARRDLMAEFERVYSLYHGRTNPSLEIWIAGAKVRLARHEETGFFVRSSVKIGELASGSRPTRRAVFPRTGVIPSCPVRLRSDLNVGRTWAGPAIIEDEDTTIVISPGDEFHRDEFGCIRVKVSRAGG